MDLKNILPKKKEDDEEYFWSLIIEPEWASAGIWKLEGDKVKVVTISPPSSWHLDEELVSACDASCSSAVQNFPEELNPPSKVVFGVVSSWVEGGEIKEEYLSKIKRVCSELSLTPVGFVVMAEALSNYYKSEEGGQVNAIFLGVSENNLELSIFRLGKLVGVSQIARSVSVVEDVTEGLSRFYSGEAYPSRIILYNSKEGELDEIKQELIKADWEGLKEVKFLHTPKIEIVAPDRKIYAVCLAGGAEMGDVTKVMPLVESPLGTNANVENMNETPESELSVEQITNVEEPPENLSPEDFGFTVSSESGDYENFRESDSDNYSQNQVREEANKEEVFSQPIMPQPVAPNQVMQKGEKTSIFTKISLPKIKFSFPKFNLKFKAPKTIFIGLMFLFLLLGGFFAFWWFFPKAEVTLYVSPKKIEDEVEISVDASSNTTDFENAVVSGEVVTKKTSGEKSMQTTGTKVIGDKATGEITIYRAGSSINLTKNTIVKGPGSLNFSLDEDTTVASGSVLTRGITKVKVTAKEIGAQYNLASGTTFTISNYSSSDMEATNESAFSGGSSREVNAISEGDQKNLLESLQEELETTLKDELENAVSSDYMLITDSITYSVAKKDYDKKVGDEGSSLKLTLDLEAEGVLAKRSEIEELGLKYLNERVPSGYSLKNDQIQADFTYKNKKDDTYYMSLFVSANLLPQVDIDEIRKNITGKYPETADEYMKNNVPGYVRSVINFKKFRFPGKLGTLPRIADNIEISISAEK